MTQFGKFGGFMIHQYHAIYSEVLRGGNKSVLKGYEIRKGCMSNPPPNLDIIEHNYYKCVNYKCVNYECAFAKFKRQKCLEKHGRSAIRTYGCKLA